MTITKERLAEVKARCDAATPGPWEAESYGDGIGCVREILTVETGDDVDSMNVPTACFIATARTDVPDLVAEVERLRGLIAATTETHEYCPWCGRYKTAISHTPACPTFTPDGEVK